MRVDDSRSARGGMIRSIKLCYCESVVGLVSSAAFGCWEVADWIESLGCKSMVGLVSFAAHGCWAVAEWIESLDCSSWSSSSC